MLRSSGVPEIPAARSKDIMMSLAHSAPHPPRQLVPQRIVRRLIAAEGYLELDLPSRSLAELDQIGHPSEAGLLEPYVHYLRGESLKDLERFHDAINFLHEAARTIPAPFNSSAWLSLGECFRHDGQPILAEVAEMFAETPPEPLQEQFAMEDPAFGCQIEAFPQPVVDLKTLSPRF
jgi:hypothetical protein